MRNSDVIIIGGGLAGLIAGIHLSKKGFSVIIIEKNNFPKHKVCGEYISNEVTPYLKSLGINLSDLKPTNISTLQFSTTVGKTLNTKLPLGGFGISRYELDFYLYNKAIENGCSILHEEVENVEFDSNIFSIRTTNRSVLTSKIAIGAFGKRSNIDIRLNRKFIQKKSPWLAVKAHYKGVYPDSLVGLHNFKGGYCGVSKVEKDLLNICYLVQYEAFKEYKNTNDFQNLVVKQNPHLNEIFENSKMVFEKPLTISQISFEKKVAVENHILMIGDTAGLIHPLCGNGMAMAIHSAKLVSDLICKFITNEIKSRDELEKEYIIQWNYNFKTRMNLGRLLASTLLKPKLSEALLRILIVFPFLFKAIIKKTHGKPIKVDSLC